jgi:MATE family multidrug resistance protein
MLIIMVLNFLVGLADVYVAGFIGPGVQAVVGYVAQIYLFITIVANALSIGTLALVARAAGAGEKEKAVRIARQSLILALLLAFVLSIAGLLFYNWIVLLAGFPPGIREIAGKFLKVFSLALGPNYILIISNAVFRATGEVKKPLFAMTIASVINIALDFSLVFGIYPFPEMGYIGVAVATALAAVGGMLINLFFFTRDNWEAFYRGPWRPSLETARSIVSIGWPAGMIQVVWNAGYLIIYNILSRLGAASVTALAALTNGLRIEAVIYLPAFALNMAASVLIGQNLGAGNPARAEKAGWKVAQAGVILITAMAIIIFIRAEDFAAIVARTPPVQEETARYLRITMLSEPFMAASSILGGGLQGAGDTRAVMRVIIISMWIIRLPLAYLFSIAMGYGALGMWVAMVSSMIFQGVLMARTFQKGRWKKVKVDAQAL